jgi:hypothetical protein
MFNSIEEIQTKYNIELPKNKSVLDIFNNNFEKHFDYDNETLSIIGMYYQYVEKDYNQMKKYYLMCIMDGNSAVLYGLGYYYQFIEKDYDLMKKFYKLASKKENINTKVIQMLCLI